MRGCTCTGRTLCPQCQAWANYGVLGPVKRAAHATTDEREADEPEATFQARILRLAKQHGWLDYHTRDSRGSAKGFPDVVLVRESIIFAELKTNTGKITPEQERWINMLIRAKQVEVYLWRPADWPTIEARLTQPWRHEI